MQVNTTSFCFDAKRHLVKTDSRLSVNVDDELIKKLHNKVNTHVKNAALTRHNAVITTNVERNVGMIYCNGELAYVVKLDKCMNDGNMIYYSNHMIVVNRMHGVAHIYEMPFENSAPIKDIGWDSSSDLKERKSLKACLRYIDELFIKYTLRLIDEQEKEKEENAYVADNS